MNLQNLGIGLLMIGALLLSMAVALSIEVLREPSLAPATSIVPTPRPETLIEGTPE